MDYQLIESNLWALYIVGPNKLVVKLAFFALVG